MALCDLSAHNPNVLFELGLRQAFDKPVVLVEEVGTAKIFDVGLFRIEKYRKALRFNEVPEDQDRIAQVLVETKNAPPESINSIVRLLGFNQAADIPEVPKFAKDPAVQLIRNEISSLRDDIRNLQAPFGESDPRVSLRASDLLSEIEQIKRMVLSGQISVSEALEATKRTQQELEGMARLLPAPAVWQVLNALITFKNDLRADHTLTVAVPPVPPTNRVS